jgi:hypothetical protein
MPQFEFRPLNVGNVSRLVAPSSRHLVRASSIAITEDIIRSSAARKAAAPLMTFA